MMFNDKCFEEAFNKTIIKEGGYVNNPDDRGGETKYGISKKSYPKLDIKNLKLEDAMKIYYVDFWIKNKCNVIDYFVAEKLFDLSVNMGCKKAAIVLQRALRATSAIKLEEDGIIGPLTLDAIRRAMPDKLLIAIKSEAAGFYRLIVANDNTQKKFLTGWLNRAYA